MMSFFLLGGFIACAGKHVGASCPVVMSPPAVVVAFGNSFSVNCTSLSNQIDGMGWESSAGGTKLTTNVTSVPLNIASIQQWSLEPTCYINFISGRQCLTNLPVTVYKTPDIVTVSQLSPTDPMVEGRMYILKCNVANVAPARSLSVQWYKGNEMFHTETFTETSLSPLNMTSTLNLTAHRDDNGTQIWCKANLNFFPAGPNISSMSTKREEMTVLYPPTFFKPANETVEIKAKSKLLLNCTATGNPAPVYSWDHPRPSEQTNEDKNENPPIFSPSYHLPGNYSCTVSNSQGTKTKYFNVIQEPGNRTTFAAIVAVFVCLGILLFIAGFFFVTPNGSFSLNTGSYMGGQPVPSGPV
ncbi:Intercellular adhesion molecule 2 [Channa argus]|uniref:Intercellular adhesion molecule 2 n=1 Tax=Channa argus TaxID=215402 RepID=A0A6G1QC19_CHAAH|nr:Intercellular adhesion molecule 2 [Channa argus]